MKIHKKFILFTAALLLLLGGLICGAAYARNLPVDWDAGACGGGYAAFIFDKYSNELVQKYLDIYVDKNKITSIEAIKGSQTAEWEDQTIYLQFDIEYQHSSGEKHTERLHCIGKRIWFDTYDWDSVVAVKQ